jgi:hypothetical protein
MLYLEIMGVLIYHQIWWLHVVDAITPKAVVALIVQDGNANE